MQHRLRIFPAAESVQSHAPAGVTLRLSEILEPLAEAFQSQRAFLDDFADDEIQISPDLYEALMASVYLRKSA
ncbi:MAG: hypothetical protein HQ518_32055 [Rhodopirellula sp.]|nr:hypothetical protein [Rhodopirellula sp.]